MTCELAIIGEFDPDFEPHLATNRAIDHSKAKLGLDVEAKWYSSEDCSETILSDCHGLWVAPGSPFKNMEKTLLAIKFSRDNSLPTLGTCGGFQHIIIEYARNVLGFADAQHAEYDPYSSKLFVSELACSLAGREMILELVPDSLVATIYGRTRTTEKYYCNFGVNPEHVATIKNGPLKVVGSDSEGEIRVVEYEGHPFFVGTLFVPQAQSVLDRPHPLVTGFLKAMYRHEHRGTKNNKSFEG